MQIRALLATDADAFQALRLSGLQETPTCFASSYDDEKSRTTSEIATRIAPGPDQAVFGAFDGERLVGIAGVRRATLQKYRHKVGLWGVYVHPDSRGTGVSRQLLTQAIDFAKSLSGVTQMNLTVTGANANALGLYRKLGFVEFGSEPDALFVDGQFHDERHMSLRFDKV